MRVRELSVFLPCYEEEGSVARTVERASRCCANGISNASRSSS